MALASTKPGFSSNDVSEIDRRGTPPPARRVTKPGFSSDDVSEIDRRGNGGSIYRQRDGSRLLPGRLPLGNSQAHKRSIASPKLTAGAATSNASETGHGFSSGDCLLGVFEQSVASPKLTAGACPSTSSETGHGFLSDDCLLGVQKRFRNRPQGQWWPLRLETREDDSVRSMVGSENLSKE